MKITHPPLLDRMKDYMDQAVQNQKRIASNLANVDTPGYRAKGLEFGRQLQLEMERPWMDSQSRQLSDPPVLLRPAGQEPSGGSLGRDGNDVDADRELTRLAQNLLKFSLVTEMYRKKVETLRSAVAEGRS